MIPSIEACYRLMDRYQMPDHIKAHSVVVAKIAHSIAKGLTKAGSDISIEKTLAAALMHDIGKTACLNYGGNHAEIGKQICLHNHLTGIAEIVGEHVILQRIGDNGHYSESEIVYYADKRVNHDKIVSLEERLSYILERYARNREDIARRIMENFRDCKRVEERLFDKLNFTPESLPHLAAKERILG